MLLKSLQNPLRGLIDGLVIVSLNALLTLFNVLPLSLRFHLVRGLLRIFLFVKPKYLALSERQIADSFPEKSALWHHETALASGEAFVRAVVDFFRGPFVSQAWIAQHVTVSGYEELKAHAATVGKPVVLVGGHVGSFDLLAQLTAVFFRPISFVIRNAKQPAIDKWWSAVREMRGNSTIPRSGAIKAMLKAIRSGRDVGILFDQNVTAEFAVFVPWFGRLAATTKAVAMVALKTECLVAVSTLHYIGNEQYRLECIPVPVDDIYSSGASAEEKAFALTDRAVRVLETQIKKFPEQWFWMHRRWRTRPPGENSAGLSDPLQSISSN